MLCVTQLRVILGRRTVLQDLSFDVRPGELLAVLGGNGTGKSTLLRTLMGLLRPCAGSALCFGRSLVGREPHRLRREGLAYLPQHGAVFPDLSVAENLRLAQLGRTPKHPPTGVGSLLRHVYDGPMGQRAGLLSRGQQQLLSLDMTLADGPRVLLLDEPFAPLSERARRLTADLLLRYATERPCILVVAEHHLTYLPGIPTTTLLLDDAVLSI